jgi:hypothetical protein
MQAKRQLRREPIPPRSDRAEGVSRRRATPSTSGARRVLLTELGCVNCHAASGGAAVLVERRRRRRSKPRRVRAANGSRAGSPIRRRAIPASGCRRCSRARARRKTSLR